MSREEWEERYAQVRRNFFNEGTLSRCVKSPSAAAMQFGTWQEIAAEGWVVRYLFYSKELYLVMYYEEKAS